MPVQRFVGIPPNQHDTGDIESMDLLAGQSVGLVAEIQPAGELVRRITRGAEELISRKTDAPLRPGIASVRNPSVKPLRCHQ